MKSPAAHLPTAYDWISPEDVIRHALAAYYCICRESDAYMAENYEDPHQVETNDRRSLAERIGELFGARLLDHGFKAGAPGFYDKSDWFARRFGPTLSEKLLGLCPPNIGQNQDIHCAPLVAHRQGGADLWTSTRTASSTPPEHCQFGS